MNGLAIVIEECEIETRIVFGVFVKFIKSFIVLAVEVYALLIIILQVLDEKTGLADLDWAQLEKILTNRHILDMLSHLLLIFWTIIDKGV